MSDESDGYTSQHQYYARRNFFSTFRGISSNDEMLEHTRKRNILFEEKLQLPSIIFRNSEVLEFGTDTGENAVAFANLGAYLTLVEPNRKAHSKILGHFRSFQQEDRIRALVDSDLLSFSDERQYDFIDAEGFIYTVKPTEAWLKIFAKQLRPGGLFLISYIERHGAFVEASMKAAHRVLLDITGAHSEVAAEQLFASKWRAFPSSRPFSTWIKDILESPFIRQKYFLDGGELCRAALAHGFVLHSSWPVYHDATSVYWFKHSPPPEERLTHDLEQIARARIGHMLGCRAWLVRGLEQALPLIAALVDDVDCLVEASNNELAEKVALNIDQLCQLINGDNALTDGDRPKRILTMLANLFRLLAAGNAEAISSFCNSDPTFIAEWGLPSHFAVFRKIG